MINGKKIAIVLGGGANLGFAHVGVLKFMEEIGIVPDIIAGTSAGALIGGAYANGMKIDELIEKISIFDKSDIYDMKIFPFLGDSVMQSKKLNDYILKLFGDSRIEDTKIKFCAVAVDLKACKAKYFKRGLLWEAVRCSISVPGIFTPYEIQGVKYIDGGIVDNLPTAIAKQMGANIVISINVIDYDNALLENKTAIHSLVNALTISQKEILRLRTKADIEINLKLKNITMFSFKREESLSAIKQGYEQVKRKRKLIENVIYED